MARSGQQKGFVSLEQTSGLQARIAWATEDTGALRWHQDSEGLTLRQMIYL
jgi:hypothetical protein